MGFAVLSKTRCELWYLPATDRLVLIVKPPFGLSQCETIKGTLEAAALTDGRRGFFKNKTKNTIVVLDNWEE